MTTIREKVRDRRARRLPPFGVPLRHARMVVPERMYRVLMRPDFRVAARPTQAEAAVPGRRLVPFVLGMAGNSWGYVLDDPAPVVPALFIHAPRAGDLVWVGINAARGLAEEGHAVILDTETADPLPVGRGFTHKESTPALYVWQEREAARADAEEPKEVVKSGRARAPRG